MKIYFFDSEAENLDIIHALLPLLQSKNCTVGINVPPAELLTALPDEKSIVVFLDTRYQGTGFSFAKTIREVSENCHIVFMSAHAEDMSFCFKNLIRPSGFILKPTSESEILEVIRTVLQKNRQTASDRVEKIYITTQGFKRTLSVQDIIYFSTRGKKLVCRTLDGEAIEFYGTIKSLSARYTANFIRCHSGFLANREMIRGIKKGMLEMKNCTESLPISKKHRAEISVFLRHGAWKQFIYPTLCPIISLLPSKIVQKRCI